MGPLPKQHRRRLCMLFTLMTAVVVVPPAARGANNTLDAAQWTALGLLHLVPDLRYEAADEERWVMTWPVTYTLKRIDFLPWETDCSTKRKVCSCRGQRAQMLPQAFVEPQRTYGDGTWRVLAGARSFIFGHPWKAYGRPLRMHLLAEGFGVLGQDGRGVGVGAGVGYRGIVSLAYRRLWTDQGQRQSVTLDVHLFGAPHYAKGRKTWQNHSKHLLSEIRESERIRAACFSQELPYGLPPNPTPNQPTPEWDATAEESSPERPPPSTTGPS